LDLLEGEAGCSARRHTNSVEVAIEHVIELATPGSGRGVGIVDDQMVDSRRVVRIREIGLAEYNYVTCCMAIDE
jgi:hypothetical protein